ncbi:hypothetical protein [Companilactobacillus tucceti]|nr:hypothetical protein [Companilactobacillus tucceti]
MKLFNMLRKIDEKPDLKNETVTDDSPDTQEKDQITSSNNNTPAETSDESANLPVSIKDQRIGIEDQMNELSHQYTQLRNDLKTNLFTEKDELENKKDTLSNYLDTLNRDQTETDEKLADIKSQNDNAEKEKLARVRADQKEQEDFLSDYKDQKNTLTAKLERNQQTLEEKQKDLADNEQSEKDLSGSIKEEKDLQKMLALMEDQKTAINKLYEQRAEIQKDIDDVNEEIQKLNSQLDEVNGKINQTNSAINSLKGNANQIESKIKNDRNYRIETTASLERHVQSLDEEHKKIESELSEVNNNKAYIEKYIKDVFHSAFLVRDVYLDKDKDYYVLADSFDNNNQMNNLFDMIRFLESKLQKPVTVISTFYDEKLSEKVDSEIQSNHLETPNVVNLFDQLQVSADPTEQPVTIPENDGWITRTDVESKDTLIYDQNNNLLMTVEYDEEKINRINYYKNEQINKTNIYNAAGQLSSVQIFNKKQELTEQSFYRTDGSIVLTVIFDGEKANSYQLFDANGLLEHDFNKKDELIAWWLKSLTLDSDNSVFVGNNDDLLYKLITNDNKIESDKFIPLLTNAQKNIKEVINLLTANTNILNILVEHAEDLQAIETSTTRDISVSSISHSSSNELYLPDSLKI